jgi:hypothetical protein
MQGDPHDRPSDGPAAPDGLAAAEHARREAAWNPLARWLALQRTIGWAAAQATVRRNTPAACLASERRLLHGTR